VPDSHRLFRYAQSIPPIRDLRNTKKRAHSPAERIFALNDTQTPKDEKRAGNRATRRNSTDKKRRYVKTFRYNGKKHFVYGKTQSDADAKAAIKRYRLETGEKQISKHMLCVDWTRQYFTSFREPVVSPSTHQTDIGIWQNHVLPVVKDLALVDVKPLHLQTVLNNAAAAGHRRTYLKKCRLLMRGIFREAVKNGLLIENPADDLRLPDCEEDGTNRTITPEERAALLIACERSPYPAGLYAKLMLYCGCRPIETSLIRGKHIDVANSRLFIDGTKTKAAKRYVPIPAVFLPDLEPYADRGDTAILLNASGKTMTKKSRVCAWERLKKEMHISLGGKTDRGNLKRVLPPYIVAPDFTPYCLRHTYCTDLQDAGVPINVAKEFMGHSSISLTAKIYTHLTADSFASSASLINSKLTTTLTTSTGEFRADLGGNQSEIGSEMVQKTP